MSELDGLREELHQLRLSIGEMKDTILDRIDSAYVRRDTYALEIEGLRQRIAGLETARNWLVGLIVAAVLVAVLRLVIR